MRALLARYVAAISSGLPEHVTGGFLNKNSNDREKRRRMSE